MMLDAHGGRPLAVPPARPRSSVSKSQAAAGRSRCFERAANTASCPGGWTKEGPTWHVGPDGIKRTSEVFECKTDSSDSGDSGKDG